MSWLSSAIRKGSQALGGVERKLSGVVSKKLGQIGQVAGGIAGGLIAGPRGAQFGAQLGKKLTGGLAPKTYTQPSPLRPLAPSGPVYNRQPGMPAGLPNLPTAPRKPMGLSPKGMQLPQLPKPPANTAPGSYGWFDQNIFAGWLPGGTAPRIGSNALGSGGGLEAINGQIPMVTDAPNVTVPRAPRGYVLVRMPDGSVKAVLKEVAYALGLRKRPKKRGGISSKDISTARKVQHLITSLTVARHPRTPIRKKARR